MYFVVSTVTTQELGVQVSIYRYKITFVLGAQCVYDNPFTQCVYNRKARRTPSTIQASSTPDYKSLLFLEEEAKTFLSRKLASRGSDSLSIPA